MSDSMDATDGLKTLEKNGYPPSTRMANARDAANRIQVMLNSERQGRSQRRALVKGLVDGNPPYRQEDNRRAGRAQACNVNWRIAESYLNMARYAIYDVFSESPTFCTVRTDFGSPSDRIKWSGIITEEFDYLIRTDKSWDTVNQFSIYDMVLYGCGPLVFPDNIDWRNEFVTCGNLIVPDFTPSVTEDWEEVAILREYLPHELYDFIRNPKMATDNGWNVEVTQQAIMRAHPKWQEGGQYHTWEWHQQQFKNRSFQQSAESKKIQTSHYYFKEFPEPGQRNGKITHCIVINPEDNQSAIQDYLFRSLGQYDAWNQIVHPMYYDNDGGGYHHSVTGLGTKMYSAMEYQNRLLCNAADKAFAPKLFFRSLNANASEKMSLVQFGEYGQVPANFDVVQTPVQSLIDETILLNREITGLLSSNLSQYRSNLSKEQGNPITAYEASVRASEQSRLGKTQLNHYYQQLDWLYAEKYRRAVNPKLTGFMPGGYEAKQFQQACIRRGVPMQALQKVESVKATRIAGQGSQFMRQQVMQEMIAMLPLLNEEGRQNAIDDFIASKTGQAMVDRYNPKSITSPEMMDQKAIATLQVVAAKEGVPPVVGGSQNHMVFATVFLESCAQSVGSLNQGGNPAEVLVFLGAIIPAIGQHLMYIKQDPSRQREAKAIEEQLKQFVMVQKQLGAQLQQLQQQAQQQAQQQEQRMTAMQLDQWESQQKIRMQQQKTDAGIAMKAQKQNQSLALADASTASDISRKNIQTQADITLQSRKAEAETAAE